MCSSDDDARLGLLGLRKTQSLLVPRARPSPRAKSEGWC